MDLNDPISARLLLDDCEAEVSRIVSAVRTYVRDTARKRGIVLGLSGGIDSSLTAVLCVKALGVHRVQGLLMPERESSSESEHLARMVADHLGIATVREDIAPILDAAGCYRRRDEAIRSVVPQFGRGFTCKLVLPSMGTGGTYRRFEIVVASPGGEQTRTRLTHSAYLGVVAATNFKQRVRKMLEYFHADRLNYAVAGTPNRLEYDQGFFVKLGDGAADIKPIAHLYKTRVYQLAAFLGLPREVRERPPTTDTYPMAQSQEEFFFSVPLQLLDLCLYGRDCGMSPREVAHIARVSPEHIERVYDDIDAKRQAARYLHAGPVVVGKVWRGKRECGMKHVE